LGDCGVWSLTADIVRARDGNDEANANVMEYPTGDNHLSKARNQKATVKFLPLLNNAYSFFETVPEFPEIIFLAFFMICVFAITFLCKRGQELSEQSAEPQRSALFAGKSLSV
jgi:hypothetical protein